MNGPPTDMASAFEAERPRLVGLAARVLSDRVEAEDMVQQAWLRLVRQERAPDSLPAWLTTVTTRLCLDRLRARTPEPAGDPSTTATVDDGADRSVGATSGHGGGDGAEDVVLAETVGAALQVVLDRLTPSERVAFVLHDSFGFEFTTIARILDTSPAAARKLASRARARVRQPTPEDALADWQVVDAFMAAARGGDLARLVQLLAPDVTITADEAAVEMGTPERIDGRDQVSAFFDGSAKAARSVALDGRPAAAWIHRGEAKVLFDFVIASGVIEAVTFRADPDMLARVVRRDGPPTSR